MNRLGFRGVSIAFRLRRPVGLAKLLTTRKKAVEVSIAFRLRRPVGQSPTKIMREYHVMDVSIAFRLRRPVGHS